MVGVGINIQKQNNILMEKFKNHEIEKRYLAKVIGLPIKKKDTLVHYLFKDNKIKYIFHT